MKYLLMLLAALSLLMLVGNVSAIGLAGSTFDAAFGTNPYSGTTGSGSYSDFLAAMYADFNAMIAMGPNYNDGSLAPGIGYGGNGISSLNAMIAGGYAGTI